MKYVLRIAVVLGGCALTLFAEDFWLKKPYTEWAEKDAAKLLQNSPWAHQISISMGGGQSREGGTEARGRRGGMGDATAGAMDSPNMDGPNSRGRGSRGGGDMESLSTGPSVMLTVRWQSAMPIRQATVISKLGRAKANSDEATKFLNQAMPGYVVGIIGLPARMARIPVDRLNEIAKTSTALNIKDKDPIPAVKAEPSAHEDSVDVYFIFPTSSPIALEDKEVEFVAKVGQIEVKRKFKLKDMVVGDKLAL